MDAGFWDPVRAALPAGHAVLTPEFPGLGAAEPVDGPTVEGFAEEVAGRIAALPGGRAAVCGLSLGGYVALALAAAHPERVGALVLADTRAEPDTDEAQAGRHAAAALVRERGSAPFLDDFIPRLVPPEDDASRDAARAIADRQSPEAVARALEALAARGDRRPDLARVACPTLVIVGDRDALTPPSFARTLAEGIAGARLRILPGAGHLTALERPEEFAAILDGFLRDLPA